MTSASLNMSSTRYPCSFRDVAEENRKVTINAVYASLKTIQVMISSLFLISSLSDSHLSVYRADTLVNRNIRQLKYAMSQVLSYDPEGSKLASSFYSNVRKAETAGPFIGAAASVLKAPIAIVHLIAGVAGAVIGRLGVLFGHEKTFEKLAEWGFYHMQMSYSELAYSLINVGTWGFAGCLAKPSTTDSPARRG